MKLTQRLSLKLRLTLLFLALSLTAWFAASLVAWQQTTHKLDKLFDTQQMLFAKRLLTMDLDEIRAPNGCARSRKSEAWPSGRRRAGFRHLRRRRQNAAERR
jgi:hypothetical protein